ncbi:hypothetical protein [Paracoccus fistulariae]|uniref:MFS transporter n=1 Tax=Paracoccus fistulariae TaxID=658446 RepID=A0ABY7SJ37_9RHOB|nr:hypothetical protein [Paracoccus fistulariae]MDB6181776.1 hypothetical protein [Paracoccus fistulariae]WCR05931.1 hypothetical protein JHX87_10365 [Paracoccus fistulariae]
MSDRAPRPLHYALSPVMIGYNFQQTALLGMLPVLALQLDLPAARVGLTVSAGLIVAAVMAPLLAGRMTVHSLRAAMVAIFAASLALMALLLWPRPAGAAFAILLVIRCVQGSAAAVVLAVAQGASAGSDRAAAALAKVQLWPGVGRAAGAALIGPLLRLSIVLPILPALIGAAVSMIRLCRGPQQIPHIGAASVARAPWIAALAVPFLVQAAIGAAQLGLGPLLALKRPAEQAAGLAGLCLAAGYLALVLTHSALTGRSLSRRPAAALLATALLLPLISDWPGMLILATALAAGASGLLIARHLARVITARPADARQNAAWQGSALLAGLGTGAGAGSLVLPLNPTAPFLLGSGFALFTLLICQRTP